MVNMILKSIVHRLPNIKGGNRHKGALTWCYGMYGLLMIVIMCHVLMWYQEYRLIGMEIDDALAAAGLAASVIDVRAYGINHEIRIEPNGETMNRYSKAITDCLKLTESFDFTGYNADHLGTLSIDEVLVYNVENGIVHEYSVTQGRELRLGNIGEIQSPDHKTVSSTGVYGHISFDCVGLFGIRTRASKGKLVEVKNTL